MLHNIKWEYWSLTTTKGISVFKEGALAREENERYENAVSLFMWAKLNLGLTLMNTRNLLIFTTLFSNRLRPSCRRINAWAGLRNIILKMKEKKKKKRKKSLSSYPLWRSDRWAVPRRWWGAREGRRARTSQGWISAGTSFDDPRIWVVSYPSLPRSLCLSPWPPGTPPWRDTQDSSRSFPCSLFLINVVFFFLKINHFLPSPQEINTCMGS